MAGSRNRRTLIALSIAVGLTATVLLATGCGKTSSGARGVVRIPGCDKAVLVVAKTPVTWDSKRIPVPVNGGKFDLHEGAYQVIECSFTMDDAKDETWVAEGMAPGYIKGGPRFRVVAGSNSTLKIGPPLTASIKAESRGSKPTFSLKLVDATGMDYKIEGLQKGPKQSEPQVQIVDSSGKVVLQKPMEFG